MIATDSNDVLLSIAAEKTRFFLKMGWSQPPNCEIQQRRRQGFDARRRLLQSPETVAVFKGDPFAAVGRHASLVTDLLERKIDETEGAVVYDFSKIRADFSGTIGRCRALYGSPAHRERVEEFQQIEQLESDSFESNLPWIRKLPPAIESALAVLDRLTELQLRQVPAPACLVASEISRLLYRWPLLPADAEVDDVAKSLQELVPKIPWERQHDLEVLFRLGAIQCVRCSIEKAHHASRILDILMGDEAAVDRTVRIPRTPIAINYSDRKITDGENGRSCLLPPLAFRVFLVLLSAGGGSFVPTKRLLAIWDELGLEVGTRDRLHQEICDLKVELEPLGFTFSIVRKDGGGRRMTYAGLGGAA